MPRGKKISIEESLVFVEMVRMNPSLYNNTATDYKDPARASSTWQNIAESMGRHDMEGVDWKKRWRNMRDVFVKKRKTIRTSKNPIVVERARNWRFLRVMSFLDGHIDESGSMDDYGPSVDSDNADFSDADISGDDGSPSWSEKPIPISLDMSCQPEVNASSSSFAGPAQHSNGNPRPTASTSNRGQKRMYEGDDDYEPEANLADVIRNHKRSRDNVQSTHPAPRSAEQLFFDSCALRIASLPEQTRSFLQFQISQLFFNAENPDQPPLPIIPLPQHQTAQSSQSAAQTLTTPKAEKDT